jgi:hypothetical protein
MVGSGGEEDDCGAVVTAPKLEGVFVLEAAGVNKVSTTKILIIHPLILTIIRTAICG